MKKISNNTFLGKLVQILNLVVVVFFILSVVFLLKFDKINVVKVNDEPAYLKAKEELHTIEHPLKQAEAEVDYYTTKLDTLKQHQATLTDKKAITWMETGIYNYCTGFDPVFLNQLSLTYRTNNDICLLHEACKILST